ncbi:30S ribosomal protein S24e [Candidatus Bathyarchaeota archaeon]|nr:MAG: 30S ribosomal protein S24e [Candidatus Bathyarchaeota archaeon]
MVEVKIVNDYKNILIGRREINFEILHEKSSTPKREEVKEKIAAKFGVKPEQVYILSMKTKTNSWITVGVAHIYDSEERAKLILPKHIIARNAPKISREEKSES